VTSANGPSFLSLFLDRTVEARRHEKPGASTTGIIPGNRGKAGSNWCCQPLSDASRRQANITSSSGRRRSRSSYATKELCDETRLETAPSRVRSGASFGLRHRCSYPEGCGCYCMTRTQRSVPVGPPHRKARPARRGAKGTRRGGERASLAKLAKPPNWGGA